MTNKNEAPIIKNLILTAGPYIDYREPLYASDAAKNGWNQHHSDYIQKLEKYFADYIGVKYAKVTSSCTGALHLALLALGIKKGDEVIVPETTWIATAAAVTYVGATPVFADICSDTWVLDTVKIEKLITSKTKAIIPVHLYGQPVEMDNLLKLANKYNLKVIEDAAPSIGTIYRGKKTGSFGDMAAFSFQGAKAVVAGEGGILVSNNKDLIDKAWFYNDHCRDVNRPLCNSGIGYKYKMSNIQASIALAQMEKVEEIVAKKRQIFNWYYERLSDIKEITLNIEKKDTRNIYWMSSIILSNEVNYTRDEFMRLLKNKNIDSRPLFEPLSSFPMFVSKEKDNEIAYSIPRRGINLPSGHMRTESEIDYICLHIRTLLGKSHGICHKTLHSDLEFKENVISKIIDAKDKINTNQIIDIKKDNITIGKLKPITKDDAEDEDLINRLATWRNNAQYYYPTQFNVTFNGTKKWLKNEVIENNDRLLYMIQVNNNYIGHAGYFRFNYEEKYCELDNIVRGISEAPGIMLYACKTLIANAFDNYNLNKIFLRVTSDNTKALTLYSKLGFKEIYRMPLMKIEKNDMIEWIPAISNPYKQIDRYFITMSIEK